jgi:hypothetical protein
MRTHLLWFRSPQSLDRRRSVQLSRNQKSKVCFTRSRTLGTGRHRRVHERLLEIGRNDFRFRRRSDARVAKSSRSLQKEYSDGAKMGSLTFSNLEIKSLSDVFAVAFGSWKLKRANDEPHGGSR